MVKVVRARLLLVLTEIGSRAPVAGLCPRIIRAACVEPQSTFLVLLVRISVTMTHISHGLVVCRWFGLTSTRALHQCMHQGLIPSPACSRHSVQTLKIVINQPLWVHLLGRLSESRLSPGGFSARGDSGSMSITVLMCRRLDMLILAAWWSTGMLRADDGEEGLEGGDEEAYRQRSSSGSTRRGTEEALMTQEGESGRLLGPGEAGREEVRASAVCALRLPTG